MTAYALTIDGKRVEDPQPAEDPRHCPSRPDGFHVWSSPGAGALCYLPDGCHRLRPAEPVVDTFVRRRLTWEDVQARLALSPLHSQRVVLVASIWGDWKGLTPFHLLGAPEPGPRGRKVLHLRNTYDDRVLAIWDESRLYGTSEDD